MVLIGHDFISKHYGYREAEEFVVEDIFTAFHQIPLSPQSSKRPALSAPWQWHAGKEPHSPRECHLHFILERFLSKTLIVFNL